MRRTIERRTIERRAIEGRTICGLILIIAGALAVNLAGGTTAKKRSAGDASVSGPYLFLGFKENGESGAYAAISEDGYHWDLLNRGAPLVTPTEKGELMRDPFVQRGPDGKFHLFWTWSWGSPAVIGYSSSTDLVHWEEHRKLAVMANEPTALNVWAPAAYYDGNKKRWLILWSSTIPERFLQPGEGDGKYNHRIYATTTKDLQNFSVASLFFDPGYNVIDATILNAGGRYYLVFKDERKNPLKKHILTASAPTLEGPWTHISDPFTETWTEGAAAIRVQSEYLVYFDHYRTPQHYGAVRSKDWQHWVDITPEISFPQGMRHGSFLKITAEEAARLRTMGDSSKN